ncbi:hypothetical protein [Paracraurococcus lichenis]|uniref:Uncharacterized protein n=1 Tax=Paracraurococcus lichenis TaxID=3064888 RepID=A0ABT9ECI9_9PROT|nr:hypothetical protein [Paracraurococcus sp. LOR1-02]MDO9713786.1 hypothetical protein [Paracraurococcus sp. LOR1-02]
MDKPMREAETPLDIARRHVAEGEARCARQAEILWEMIADDHPQAAELAQQVLATMENTLETLREHLRSEEMQAARAAGA